MTARQPASQRASAPAPAPAPAGQAFPASQARPLPQACPASDWSGAAQRCPGASNPTPPLRQASEDGRARLRAWGRKTRT
ncbi:nematocyst expressed protein 3-like [Candoia aspera]|uniref:nematocyst expressed protein 3-like n=1 Tax=Candoia aspera TaxID=51853 RepID=UPI002FD84037